MCTTTHHFQQPGADRRGITCDKPGHLHYWPTEGELKIERCEHFCLFCTGAKARKRWSSAWFLRRHIRTAHVGKEFPHLEVGMGWEKRPGGNTRPEHKKRPPPGSNRKRSKLLRQLMLLHSPPPAATTPPVASATNSGFQISFDTSMADYQNFDAQAFHQFNAMSGVVPSYDMSSQQSMVTDSYDSTLYGLPSDHSAVLAEYDQLPVEDRLMMALAPAPEQFNPIPSVAATQQPYNAPVANMFDTTALQQALVSPQHNFVSPQDLVLNNDTSAFVSPQDLMLNNDNSAFVSPQATMLSNNASNTISPPDVMFSTDTSAFDFNTQDNFNVSVDFDQYLNTEMYFDPFNGDTFDGLGLGFDA